MGSINEYRRSQIKRHFGISVSESTWKRWRRWWREIFVKTSFWKQARSFILIPQEVTNITPQILTAFPGNIDTRIILALKFMAPITAGDLRAV